MSRIIRVGSRESALAMTQTKWVINRIQEKHTELQIEITGITTKGDVILDKTLDKIGGKGLFIKELEQALLEGAIDLAVHSMKDLPSELPDGLCIAAASAREDPRDVLVTADGRGFSRLAEGALIGTSSVRREAQLAELRPDVRFQALRGNVITRLDRLAKKQYDAIVLAAAGLKRLGLGDRCAQYFTVEELVPAPGQGVLAVEARGDDDTGYLMDSVNCEEAALAVEAERACMIKLNGGCSTPIAAHAVITGTNMKIYGMLAFEDRSGICRAAAEGPARNAAELGEKLAAMLLEQIEKKAREG